MARTIEITNAPNDALERLKSGLTDVGIKWDGDKGSFRLPMLPAVSGTVEVAGDTVTIAVETGNIDGMWTAIEKGIRGRVAAVFGWN
jgi:hypothetical protein